MIKLELDFLLNWMDFFLLQVERLGTNLVAAKQADEEWKINFLTSCKASIAAAQAGYKSKVVTEFEGDTGTGAPGPEMVGLDNIVSALFIAKVVTF